MKEIIYRGLKISSPKNCLYYNVKEGTVDSLVEENSVITLTYVPGSTSYTLSESLGIEKVGEDIEMSPTYKPIRFKDVYVSLNGLKLKKQTADSHTINIIIVEDSETRVVQNYFYTIFVVSKEDAESKKFINYLFYSGNLLYLTPVGPMPSCWRLYNFPKIIINNNDLSLTSNSLTTYFLRRRYNDYIIRAIDYQDQFILEMRRIFNDYGVEFVRVNKEETLTKTSYVSYQFSQTPLKNHHVGISDCENRLLQQTIPIDFIFRTTDMPLFFDFKNKYNNLDIVTNFTEFKTTDKYGERWTAAIKWGQITEDFNQVYQQDDNSNFSYQCQFRAELFFYEIFDDRYEFLNEIVSNLELLI